MHAKSNWTSLLLAGTFFLAAFTLLPTPALAQISFGLSIGQAPPPIRYERRGPRPRAGFVWINGYWGINSGRYVWVPGAWRRPPYAGGYWTEPHYERYNGGWRMAPGHWNHARHEDHRQVVRHDDHRADRHDDNRDDHHDNGNHYGQAKDHHDDGHR